LPQLLLLLLLLEALGDWKTSAKAADATKFSQLLLSHFPLKDKLQSRVRKYGVRWEVMHAFGS